MKKNKLYYKSTTLKAVKGVEVTTDLLARINKFAQEPLTADDVYVQKYILAHNGIDRDRERFPEGLLEDYARTLPGKSFLEVHDKSKLPLGLYFYAETEQMTKEQFLALTGEDIRLPDGIDMAMVVNAWIYTLTKEWNRKLIDNLKAGIYRHTSIGFSAADRKPVKGEYDQILYWEYLAPGEAREGSIVYLGAQQGATVQKDPDIQDYKSAQEQIEKGEKLQTLNTWLKQTKKPTQTNIDNPEQEGGKKEMDLKQLLEKMSKSLNRHIDENNVIDEVKAMQEAGNALTEAKAAITEKEKIIKEQAAKITGLEQKAAEQAPLAEEGKAYRSTLVEDCVKMKAKLGDVSEKEEDQKSVRAAVEKFDIGYLKKENEILEKRVAEKFPAEGQTKGDEKRDKSQDKDGKAWESSDKNPLITKDTEKK